MLCCASVSWRCSVKRHWLFVSLFLCLLVGSVFSLLMFNEMNTTAEIVLGLVAVVSLLVLLGFVFKHLGWEFEIHVGHSWNDELGRMHAQLLRHRSRPSYGGWPQTSSRPKRGRRADPLGSSGHPPHTPKT